MAMNQEERASLSFSEALGRASVLESTPSAETEPFKNCYIARDILTELCKQHPITNEADCDDVQHKKNTLESLVAQLRLGRNFSACEEASSAEHHLSLIAMSLDHKWFQSQVTAQRVEEANENRTEAGNQEEREGDDIASPITKSKTMNSNTRTDDLPTGAFATVLMATYKHLAAIWASRVGQQKLAAELLRRALLTHSQQSPSRLPSELVTYTHHTEQTQQEDTSTSKEYVDEDLVPDKILPYLHFFLAQVLMESDRDEAMKFCLLTLRASPHSSFAEVHQWVSSGNSVAKYFIDRLQFREASKCLLAASHVLSMYRKTRTTKTTATSDERHEAGPETSECKEEVTTTQQQTREQQNSDEEREVLQSLQADLHCQSGALYLQLLQEATRADSSDADAVVAVEACLTVEVEAILETLSITAPSDPLLEQPTHNLINSVGSNAAAEIFKRGFYPLEKAKQVYALDGHVTKHVEILKQQSGFYSKLAELDADPKRRAAMQGRRIKLLHPITDLLNPKIYLATLQEILYDLVQASAAKVQEQQMRVTRGNVSSADVRRVNEAASQVVLYFERFRGHCDFKDFDTLDALSVAFLNAAVLAARAYDKVPLDSKLDRCTAQMNVQLKIKKLCESVLEFHDDVMPEEQRDSCAHLVDLTRDILGLTCQQLDSISSRGYGVSDWQL